jgi:tetratricopeptide (TPR) repeat protein
VSRDNDDKSQEADCYQRIGLIYKKQNDLEQATYYLNKFLNICIETGKKDMQGEAHKQLADAYSASGNITQAI